MKIFISLVKNEHLKLYRRKLFWMCTGVIAAIMAFLLAGSALSSLSADASNGQMNTPFMESLTGLLQILAPQGLGGILMIIIASVFVASDYEWQTFGLHIRQGTSRTQVLAAKLVTLLMATLFLVALSTLLIVITNMLIYAFFADAAFALTLADAVDIIISIGRNAFVLYPAVTLALLVTVVTRSQAAGIGVTLGYVLLIESILPPLLLSISPNLSDLIQFLPGQMIAAVQSGSGLFIRENITTGAVLSTDIAIIGIMAYVLLFSGISAGIFQRQDL
jgi:ABC-type transport system involved in multi-copper enzyme maturation permease subunit